MRMTPSVLLGVVQNVGLWIILDLSLAQRRCD